jgi:hypothetical protein
MMIGEVITSIPSMTGGMSNLTPPIVLAAPPRFMESRKLLELSVAWLRVAASNLMVSARLKGRWRACQPVIQLCNNL